MRDRCVVTDCPLFRALSDSNQIKANMNDRLYDALVTRYAPSWTSAAAHLHGANMLTGVPVSRTCERADRSADNGGFCKLGLDPAGQHHDARSAGAASGSRGRPIRQVDATQHLRLRRRQNPPMPRHRHKPKRARLRRRLRLRRQVNRRPAASIGRPRVVAPVPFVPSQVGDD